MTSHDLHYHWEWQLRSTPEQLWPYISDAQCFNRVAVGYQVHTTSATDEDVQQSRYGLRAPSAALTISSNTRLNGSIPWRRASRSSPARPHGACATADVIWKVIATPSC